MLLEETQPTGVIGPRKTFFLIETGLKHPPQVSLKHVSQLPRGSLTEFSRDTVFVSHKKRVIKKHNSIIKVTIIGPFSDVTLFYFFSILFYTQLAYTHLKVIVVVTTKATIECIAHDDKILV